MKITCDLCGGALQINLGGQGATCTNCGLSYTMDRLREKLTGATPVPPEPPKKEPVEIIYDVTDWEKVEPSKAGFDYVPEQFVMEIDGDISGQVQQGGIGLGDAVYFDGDYTHPYNVCCINDDPYMTCAKQGMPCMLDFAVSARQRKLLNNARIVTGDPNPVANAYNYPGTVEEYFSHLLMGTFGEFEIKRDVPRGGLNIPVQYLFCRNGKPVLAVFLINSNDGKGRYQVEKAARLYAPEGVSCTHFFSDYRNDAPYVIDRVRGALG